MGSLNTAGSGGSEFFDEYGNRLHDQEALNSTMLSEDESRSEEPPPPNEQPKGKTYQRYSAEQQKRLQEVYELNPHPSEKERRALSMELELEPLRVKFWFQNRRSLAKKQQDKRFGRQLKVENAKLEAENETMRQILASASCRHCGGPSSKETMAARVELLRAENHFIREEINKLTGIVETYYGIGAMSDPSLQASTFTAATAAAAAAAASSSNSTAPHVGDVDLGFQLFGRNYFD